MNHESSDNPFRLGGRYKNRKGFFTVIELAGTEMRIRWDTGEETTDSIANQARYVRSMQRDAAPLPTHSGHAQRPTNPVPPPSAPGTGTVLAAVLNPGADFTSPTAQQCNRCHRDLSQHPIVMIGPRVFCYRCSKTEYPALMDDARRARNREARHTAPARKEYKVALHAAQWANQQFSAQREAAAEMGFYTERNKWIIVCAIAIPCGILLPIVGLFAALPVLFVIQPIWDRERETSLANFDRTHKPPPAFDRTEPKPNYVPDPIVSLLPYCSDPALAGTGYDRNFILRRDDFTCQSCGCRFPSTDLEVHHVLPRAQRGSDSIRNLITLCKNCHFHEDWFDHVHKLNPQRISQKRMETFSILNWRFPRRRA